MIKESTMGNKPDYMHLRAWNRMMKSNRAYFADQLGQARAENAPADAIYKDDGTGRWHTFAEVTNENTRERMTQLVKAKSTETWQSQ
jgi:hypothetical protein